MAYGKMATDLHDNFRAWLRAAAAYAGVSLKNLDVEGISGHTLASYSSGARPVHDAQVVARKVSDATGFPHAWLWEGPLASETIAELQILVEEARQRIEALDEAIDRIQREPPPPRRA